MPTLEQLQRRIGSVEELFGVVKTMKGMAATHIRQAESAATALREYHDVVEMAFQVLLKNRPSDLRLTERGKATRDAAIIMGSDQGMCGSINQEIVAYANHWFADEGHKLADCLCAPVGARVRSELESLDIPVTEPFPRPASADEIIDSANAILVRVDEWAVGGDIARILVFRHEFLHIGAYKPRVVRLFPLDPGWLQELAARPWPSRCLPSFSMPWGQAFSMLVREHIFVVVFRALAESLASEHASRLASMQAAERNIEDRLKALWSQFHQQRQTEITEELLDAVSGFEALKGRR